MADYTFRCSFCDYEEQHEFPKKPPIIFLTNGETTPHTPGPANGRWLRNGEFDGLCYGALWEIHCASPNYTVKEDK